MGKRRIRNLLFHGVKPEEIFGFDVLRERRHEAAEKYGIRTYDDFATVFAEVKPDAMIISTPPEAHNFYFLFAARNKINFFCEVTTTDQGYDELLTLLDGSFVAAPSATFRYLPVIKRIKGLVKSGEIGKVLAFTYHLGQYLPDWHPWEDFRQVYFSKKETGACREMLPYELIWLTDLLGSPVKKISGLTEKVSDLDMTADDVYAATLKLENGVIGTIMIDLLSRAPKRTLRLIGTHGMLDWEWKADLIRIFNAAYRAWRDIVMDPGAAEKGYINTEDMYQDELKDFLDAIAGKKEYPYTFAENRRILQTLYALEEKAAPASRRASPFSIGGKMIGSGKVLVIAEAGVNHNGRLDLALKLVDAASDAGADAVKFQTFRGEDLVTASADMTEYQERNIGKRESQLEMLKKLALPESYYDPMIERCRERGIIFLSTPHGGFEAVEKLVELGVPAFKFGSGDLTNLPVLRYAAGFGKPMILGTGMATMAEVKEAVSTIRAAGNDQIVMLHCTTNYPCSDEEVNLCAMQTMMNELDVIIGYSDHTMGVLTPLMAVALGALVIEKHLTLDRNMAGPDHKASATPEELKKLVEAIRRMSVIFGRPAKQPTASEYRIMSVARKSVVTTAPVKKGEILTAANIGIKRPGSGLLPKRYFEIIGKTATMDIPADVLVTEAHLNG